MADPLLFSILKLGDRIYGDSPFRVMSVHQQIRTSLKRSHVKMFMWDYSVCVQRTIKVVSAHKLSAITDGKRRHLSE